MRVRTEGPLAAACEREGGSGTPREGTTAGHADPAKARGGSPRGRGSPAEGPGAARGRRSGSCPRGHARSGRGGGSEPRARAAAEAAARGTGERWVPAPFPERASRRPPARGAPSPRCPGFGVLQPAAGFLSPPLFLCLLLLGCSTPPRIRRGGNRLPPSAERRVPRAARSPPGALSARPRAPAAPTRNPSPLSPVLQSRGILRMPERWR